jgi:TolB-like protein/tetratricopeptide (TPR) repeat protein
MKGQPRREGGQRPSADDVRAHQSRLLASATFPAAARGRKLLEYVVEQTLAGRSERLKAYDLAVSVLGRDAGFDPQGDPIVRIEMGRLRRDLDHYYLSEGRAEPIRITIPRGHYVPAFEVRDYDATPAPMAAAPSAWRLDPRKLLGRRGAVAAGLCAVALVVVITVWAPWQPDKEVQAAGPALIVVPFQDLSDGEGGQLLANGLTNGLVTNLMRFDGLEVFAAPTDGSGRIPLPSAAGEVPAYVVTGSAQREPDRVRITATLTDRASGQVLWSQRYDQALTAATILDVEDEVAAGVASRLAQVYGVVNFAAARRLARVRPETMFAYDCVQRAFAFRRTFALEAYPAVRSCLEEAVRRDPGYAGAWAMLAFAHMDAARFELVEASARASELDAGLAAAQRAVELAPESVRSLQSLAALRFARGEYDEAERVQRRAIVLNPHDPESLAQLGWRLMARGKWEEGGTLLQEAIDRSLAVPAWYHETLAMALYLGGDLQRARDEAELGKEDCCPGYATLAIMEAALGNSAAARAALDEAFRQSPLLSRDPVALWSNFQAAPDVIARLNAGLAKAGLPIAPAPAQAPAAPN